MRKATKFSIWKSRSQVAKVITCAFLSLVLSTWAYNFLEKYLLDHVKTTTVIGKNSLTVIDKLGSDRSDPARHISESSRQIACFRATKGIFGTSSLEQCNEEKNAPSATSPDARTASPPTLPKTALISVIELMLIVGLAIQIFLAIYTLCLEKSASFDKYIFHISDWAINTPPILGVLANLLSFALMLSKGGRSVDALFSSNFFFEAVVTTLLGGLFYIVNLFLKIIIQPRVEGLALQQPSGA